MAEKPKWEDYQIILRTLREHLVGLHYITLEEDQDTRLASRGIIQNHLMHCVDTLDLFLTRSTKNRWEDTDNDFKSSFNFVTGNQEIWEILLSDDVSTLTLRWPLKGVVEVVDCYIPKSKWRSLLRWRRINTQNAQPIEFEYPNYE